MTAAPDALALASALSQRTELLCRGLEHGEAEILRHVTPTTAELLRWWFSDEACRVRRFNFHRGQRQAILNVIVAHEVLGSTDLAEWGKLFALNLQTCVTASKATLPHLQRAGAGRIVNIGAMGAVKAASGMGAYAASKSGVMRFTEALADEVKVMNPAEIHARVRRGVSATRQPRVRLD